MAQRGYTLLRPDLPERGLPRSNYSSQVLTLKTSKGTSPLHSTNTHTHTHNRSQTKVPLAARETQGWNLQEKATLHPEP